jgi:hypothetical protein
LSAFRRPSLQAVECATINDKRATNAQQGFHNA